MFDIGFSEILLIFVVALVVLGPEKLPRVASQVGRWIGRARGMARQFREQLEQEVNLEESRKTLPPQTTDSSSAPAPPTISVATPVVPPSVATPTGVAATGVTPTGATPTGVIPPAAATPGVVPPDVAPPDVAPPPEGPRQQDWVGGVTNPELPTQRQVEPLQGHPNERGA